MIQNNRKTYRPIRVLYATHEPNLTGASRSLIDLISRLDKDQVRPIVLFRKKGPLSASFIEMGIDVVYIPYTQSVVSAGRVKFVTLQKMINLACVIWLCIWMKLEKIDLVHSNSLIVDVASRAAHIMHIPYIQHIRDFVEEDHGMTFLNRNTMKKVIDNAALNIAISNAVLRKFKALVPNAKFVVVQNGIDAEKYSLERDGLFEQPIVEVLLAGRFAPGKGQMDAIKAMKIIKERGGTANFHLTLIGGVGDPGYHQMCAERIQSDHLRDVVSIQGFSNDLQTIRLKTDITLMCSSDEALGRATIEGLMAGTLVIASDSGATPEIITNNKTGIMYTKGNVEDLAQKLIWAPNHIEEAKKIAQRGQKFALKKYDAGHYAQVILQLYRDILN